MELNHDEIFDEVMTAKDTIKLSFDLKATSHNISGLLDIKKNVDKQAL